MKAGSGHILMNLFDDAVAVQQGGFTLLYQQTFRFQSPQAIPVEIHCKQAFRRTHWIGAVDDDQVHAARCTVFDPGNAVIEQ